MDPQAIARRRRRRSGTQITEQIGVDTQREAYLDWASKPNAYPN